ncbi:glycosyltransferase [Epidermidibacterium keratini]|uniref:Glycosyltransferase n=1 Tax=Epidermidibacterium keratini TaxID=1891644 RepID=A0A7L4YJ19_9ACTN|nr:glycosyltransferase family 4 protein [Epidermidibacterium keratini]QHB98932.1 glycosyltransferase [Epidermidibacterium keratini]
MGELSNRTIVEVLGTSTGGVGTHLRGLVPYLVDAGADVAVVGPQGTQDLFDFTGAGARFAAVEISARPHPKDAQAASRLRAATADADLLHAHGLRAATVAAAANVGRSIPLVVTLHNHPEAASPLIETVYGALERFVASQADVMLGASEDLAQRARDAGSARAEYAPVAPREMGPATRTPAEVRRELQVPDGRPLVLAVGRLHQQKGYDTLLAAAKSWRTHPAHPQVVVAGDGPLQSQLQGQIDADDLPVRLLGRRSDVPDLLGAASLVVLPSLWEARSLVAQEAMRAGVALVSTTTGGMGELVGDAAYRIPVSDPDALAAAVIELIEDPKRRAALAAAGAARASGFATEADTAAHLISLYRQELDRR